MEKPIKNTYNYLIFILILFSLFNCTYLYEYCDWRVVGSVCMDYTYNIMCGGEKDELLMQDKVYFPSTMFGDFFPTNDYFREIFIAYHNDVRDIFASGQTISEHNGTEPRKHYPSASRMREMLWHKDLEYTAMANLRLANCMQHDWCHGSNIFAYGGQNLGCYSGSSMQIPWWSEVNRTMWIMFDEKNFIVEADEVAHNIDMKWVAESGHFLQQINDRQTYVGCAASVSLNCCNILPLDRRTTGTPLEIKECWWGCYYWACNFESENVVNKYVYKVGPPASNCSAWETEPHPDYPHLCKSNGKIYPAFLPGENAPFDQMHIYPPYNYTGPID